MKQKVTHRIYSNVSDRDFVRLSRICATFGFKSIYQLIQVLLRCFLRYADAANHQADHEEYSMGREIEEMFDDLMEPMERQVDSCARSPGFSVTRDSMEP